MDKVEQALNPEELTCWLDVILCDADFYGMKNLWSVIGIDGVSVEDAYK